MSLIVPDSNYRGKRSRELSGNDDSTGYLAAALPVGSLAGEEGVVRRRLHVAVDVERPRRDFVLARGGRPPVEPPEPPGVATGLFPAWRRGIEPRRHPGFIVDLDQPADVYAPHSLVKAASSMVWKYSRSAFCPAIEFGIPTQRHIPRIRAATSAHRLALAAFVPSTGSPGQARHSKRSRMPSGMNRVRGAKT